MACSTGRIFPKAFLAAVLLSRAILFAGEAGPATAVSIPADDVVSLAAIYAPPAAGRGVIVMLHGLDSDKGEWNGFGDVARARGWGTLAYDARGHAESAKGRAPGFRRFGSGGPGSEWDRMPQDLGKVVRYLNDKGVSTSSIVVCGASLGANVAARYAARGAKLRALVLMSPGLNYVEFRPESDVGSISSPILIIASPSDKYAYLSSRKLQGLGSGITLWSDVNPGHGVQMFDPALSRRLLEWLETR